MSAPAVRTAGPFDLTLLAEMHRACFPDDPWDRRALGEILAMPGALGLIAGAACPAGFLLARLTADEGEVLSLGVLPERRGRGEAGVLLQALRAQAAAAGVARLFLEVAADNTPACRCYRRFGFAQVGRRRGYYRRPDGPPADALVLSFPVL